MNLTKKCYFMMIEYALYTSDSAEINDFNGGFK